jgi:hypothetical protein
VPAGAARRVDGEVAQMMRDARNKEFLFEIKDADA